MPNTAAIAPYQNACADGELVNVPTSGGSTGMIRPIATMSISTVSMMNGIAAWRFEAAGGVPLSLLSGASFTPVPPG